MFLLDVFNDEPIFSGFKNGSVLLGLLEKISLGKTLLPIGEPSPAIISFLSRIQDADPNVPDLGEENSNSNWGHYAFGGGDRSNNWLTTLDRWESLGNPELVCKLIAAAVKTCKVARHICMERGIKLDTSFLSDIYLDKLIDQLIEILNNAVCFFFSELN